MAKTEFVLSGDLDGPRLVKTEELEDLEDLSARCFGFTRPARGARRRRRRRLWGQSWVIADGGKPVSHIRIVYNDLLVYGSRVKAASIGGVCTDPNYRRQGIATTLLAHCTKEAAEAGAALLIISGQRGLYRRAWAVEAGAMLRAKLGPDSINRTPGGVSVRIAEPEDWAACARLYQAEPVRFVRPAAMFVQSFGHRWHREKWIVEVGGEIWAYLALSRDWGSRPDDPRRIVAEYAGCRAAIISALPALFSAGGFGEIEFEAPSHDRELVHLLTAQGLGLKAVNIRDHTFRLLNLPGLIRRLRRYAEARLPESDLRQLCVRQEGESCLFSFGEEELTLGLAQSATLVLGGPKPPKVNGELGRVLGALFPVSLPIPGLNYV